MHNVCSDGLKMLSQANFQKLKEVGRLLGRKTGEKEVVNRIGR